MQVYDAKERLGLDVSLFERLVRQGNLPVHQMLVQRRMRPSISQLIRSTIYPDLMDGECVQDYPDVAGAGSQCGSIPALCRLDAPGRGCHRLPSYGPCMPLASWIACAARAVWV